MCVQTDQLPGLRRGGVRHRPNRTHPPSAAVPHGRREGVRQDHATPEHFRAHSWAGEIFKYTFFAR